MLLATPVVAQNADPDADQVPATRTAEEALAASSEAYGPAPPEPDCDVAENPDEIVVCAEIQDQEQFRIRTDREVEDDYARRTMNKGDPKAPDVSGPGIFKGPATIGGLCFIPPCPKEPAVIIDFDELPETPPGSDADRVGRGLAPRGNDEAVADEGPALQSAPKLP